MSVVSRKRHAFIMALMICVLLLSAYRAQADISLQDDSGQRLTLQNPAQRIISMAPHLTELLFAAGAGEAIVGAVSFSDYPPAAKAIPRIGSYEMVDIERVLLLQPDLIVAWQSGNQSRQVEFFQQMGIPVYISEPHDLTDIPGTLVKLGRLSGYEDQAKTAASRFRTRFSELKSAYANKPVVSVFYQVWNNPLRTVGGHHSISQVIELCGGRNIFDDLTALAPVINLEAVLVRNPEVIVASGMDESRPEWLGDWQRWPQLQAVRENHLFFIPPDLIQRHSPRVLQGAERLCQQLDSLRQQ